MKRIFWILFGLAAIMNVAMAQETAFTETILLTSCGQSADVLMMKTLLAKDSLSFSYLPQATTDDLAGKGSVIIVLGGSSKGLGAAKISEADEVARVIALIDAAKTVGIPVLAVHMGGLNRRGALSDPFNKLGAENASRIIVVKGGNDDGFFTKLAESKSIPVDMAANSLEVGPMVKQLFTPAPTE